jgi:hypothetical protein
MLFRALGVGLVACASMLAAHALEAADADARLAAFRARAERYAELHRALERAEAPLQETDSPDQVTARERALGEALRRARAGARPGDLFGDAAMPVRALVRADWQGRAAVDRDGLLDELPALPAPEVNSVYPSSVPLATFPPALLLELPQLPEELEYRYFGSHLVLRDAEANLIVDVLLDVLDARGRKPDAR